MAAVRPSSAGPWSKAQELYRWYILSLAACLLGNLAIRLGAAAPWLPPGGRLALAVGTVLPLGLVAWRLGRGLRQGLDELLQRVALEGFAFAMIAFIPLAALVVNLRSAGVGIPRLDPADLLLAPALLVALGIALAWRRYQ